MLAGIAKIDTTSPVVVIDLHVFRFEGTAAVRNILCFQALEYLIERFCRIKSVEPDSDKLSFFQKKG